MKKNTAFVLCVSILVVAMVWCHAFLDIGSQVWVLVAIVALVAMWFIRSYNDRTDAIRDIANLFGDKEGPDDNGTYGEQ
jgi:4-hydroxybenzoate polyprenyltransferase